MNDLRYKWIESARLLRKKTQKEVADATGISQGKLSKAEQGLQELSEDYLMKLSSYYDIPLSYFEQEWDNQTTCESLLFRRKISVPAKITDSIYENVRRRKSAIDKLMSAVDMPEYDLGSLPLNNKNDIKDITKLVRFTLRCINGPLTDLAKRIENHGIIIQPFDFGTEKMDAISTTTLHGRKIIFLNNQMPNDRIKFSLAHELGHIVMHFDYLNEINSNTGRDIENEADKFASQLLMPEDEIKSQLYNLNVNKLMALKQRWHVSMRALIKRALDLNTISQEQYRNFQIVFSKKGFNKREPIELPSEKISIIEQVVDLYQTELKYSDDEMMNILSLNKNDYYEWFDTHKKTKIISLRYNNNQQ